MKKILAVFVCALALIFVPFLQAQTQAPAQSLAGTWQGMLQEGPGLRIVVHVSPDGQGGWKGEMISIDQSPTPMPVSPITQNGTDVHFTIDSFKAKYDGALSADGNTLKGTFTQGTSLPLELERATPGKEWNIDASPHKAQFVNIDKDVKLEVLDWGGNGRPLVLLAGLGASVHVFDAIAPKLAANFHVVGITRRGFGASSAPVYTDANYSVQRLSDDVLAVIHELKLEKPIIAGHSIAGQEMSYIGTKHPDEVAGLVYLDAGYPYAYYDAERGDITVDSDETRRNLDKLFLDIPTSDQKKTVNQLLTVDLPALMKDLEIARKELADMPDEPASTGSTPEMTAATAVMRGEEKFAGVKCPLLAIFASPHDLGPAAAGMDPVQRAKIEAMDAESTGAQVKAFQAGNPTARVVVLPHAAHRVFNSNQAEVLKDINEFAATLK